MLLTLDDVAKRFASVEGPVDVFSGVCLGLDAGETLALTGESGSGKSTLLHLAGALDTPDAGEITLDGTRMAGLDDRGRAALRRQRIGLVFQQFNLIPSLDLAANLAFQARLAGRHDRAWTRRLTARLGLDGLERRYPEQLSGGQAQRVAIGRALAVRPRLLLADEPTGNLDETTSDAVLALLLELVAETGAGLMLATHSERLAAAMGRQARLAGGRLS